MKRILKSLFVLSSVAVLLTGCNNKSKDDADGEGDVTQANITDITDGTGYYESIKASMSEGEDGEFRQALTTLVKPSGTVEYSSGLSTHLQQADADPDNSSNMIFFYTQKSLKKQSAGTWNREHCWPQSDSNGCWGKTNAGCDMLHIRPTYSKTNSDRGNLKYGEVSGSYLVYEGCEYGKKGTYFEPLDKVKGDCARITMYVWTAWHDYYGNKLPAITNNFQSIDLMMKWHFADLPSQQEINRNDYVQTTVQKNRNPFVDHPEYACKIWGNHSDTTKSLCGLK
ncbi:MAG: endonuclease [Bacilli bacterium]|nr:endonuclease [Bacilli bacterium]